jgi:RimJ/RimL family protein N-acetyltransferase
MTPDMNPTPHWLRAPQGLAQTVAQEICASVPQIVTDRLVLRAPKMGDYPAYEAVFTSDRAAHIGGPFSPEDSLNDFCRAVAGWMLRGTGMWTITLRGDDAALGWIYLWQERGDPDPELGWILTHEAEGQGIAYEAARAVWPRGFDLFGDGGFVSYIGAQNARSTKLAQRLGAARDLAAEAAMDDDDLHIYRYSAPMAGVANQ